MRDYQEWVDRYTGAWVPETPAVLIAHREEDRPAVFLVKDGSEEAVHLMTVLPWLDPIGVTYISEGYLTVTPHRELPDVRPSLDPSSIEVVTAIHWDGERLYNSMRPLIRGDDGVQEVGSLIHRDGGGAGGLIADGLAASMVKVEVPTEKYMRAVSQHTYASEM